MESISRYEVRCPRCDVSFPVETRKCMHCGGPTGPSRIGGTLRPGASHGYTPADTESSRFEILRELELEGGTESDARPSRMRAVVTILWVLLAIAFSVVRACSEGG